MTTKAEIYALFNYIGKCNYIAVWSSDISVIHVQHTINLTKTWLQGHSLSQLIAGSLKCLITLFSSVCTLFPPHPNVLIYTLLASLAPLYLFFPLLFWCSFAAPVSLLFTFCLSLLDHMHSLIPFPLSSSFYMLPSSISPCLLLFSWFSTLLPAPNSSYPSVILFCFLSL